MIIGFDLKSIWDKHREQFLKFYSSELTQKVDAKNLTFRYVDSEGVTYYGFNRDMALPVERLGMLYEFMEMLMKGMTVTEDEAIDKAISQALEAGLGNPKEKSAAKIGALIMEREKRRRMVIHSELLYNILAVQWVREDEDPSCYNNEVQMQKVESFKKETAKSGVYPFFQVPELKQLNSFLKMSREEWEGYWSESIVQQKVLIEALKTIYSSGQGSKKFVTTSTAA